MVRLFLLLASLLMSAVCWVESRPSAFVLPADRCRPSQPTYTADNSNWLSQQHTAAVAAARTSLAAKAKAPIELVAEPESGEEISPAGTSVGANTRMKNMGRCDEPAEGEAEDGSVLPVYNFWMTTQAEGSLVKKMQTQLLKDASSKANFPGFRKGQVPPYALPQITQFAVQESLIETIKATMAAYGLQSLKGSDGEVEVLENVEEMSKRYKAGNPFPFTATLKAVFKDGSPATDGAKEDSAPVAAEGTS